MTLSKLTADQLTAERQHYEAQATDPNASERRVAKARLTEIESEEARRRFHRDGQDKTRTHWPQVPLAQVIQESGCNLRDRGDGRLTGDHSISHGSRSGECLVVWPDYWWCSSCRAGGDAAMWVARVEGISYREAAKRLVQKYGPVQSVKGSRRRSEVTVFVL